MLWFLSLIIAFYSHCLRSRLKWRKFQIITTKHVLYIFVCCRPIIQQWSRPQWNIPKAFVISNQCKASFCVSLQNASLHHSIHGSMEALWPAHERFKVYPAPCPTSGLCPCDYARWMDGWMDVLFLSLEGHLPTFLTFDPRLPEFWRKLTQRHIPD